MFGHFTTLCMKGLTHFKSIFSHEKIIVEPFTNNLINSTRGDSFSIKFDSLSVSFNRLKLTMETPEQCVKSIQS